MPGFSSWWRSAAARLGGTVAGKPRRYFYAAGEPALVAEVEHYVRHRFLLTGRDTSIKDALSIDGGDLRAFTDLRPHLEVSALDAPYRLIVVRHAEALPAVLWSPLTGWALTAPGHIYLLFLGSHEARWNERNENDLRHALFVGNQAGIYVNCRQLDEERQITYVRNKAPLIQIHHAQQLAALCGGDLVRLKSEVEKLMACADLNGFISDQLFSAAVTASPGDQFVEALSREDRVAALARAPFVRSAHAVLSQLERRLTELFLIRTAMRVHGDRSWDRKLADYTNLPIFTIRRLRQHARTFDLATVRTRYDAIIEAYRTLARIGDDPARVLVPLVARW